MAAVFDIDSEWKARVTATVDAAVVSIETAVSSLGPRDAVQQLQRVRRRVASVEARILADHVSADGNTRGAKSLLGDGNTSQPEQALRARRAAAVAANQALADKLADGVLSEDQVDLIADAAAKTDGAAAVDDALIDDIASVDPDQGRGIKDDWVSRHNAGGTQSEHDRQRSLRRMVAYLSNKHGLAVTGFEGDAVSQRHMLDAIPARADELYRADGGRDLPAGQHPRTRAQREFDAAYELICGIRLNPDGTITETPDSDTADSGAADGGSTDDDVSTDDRRRCGCRKRQPNRPQIVVGLTVEKMLGLNPGELAEQIGLGLIPDTVLAHYAAYGDILGALFDRNGDQLWQGRLARDSSQARYIALVLRDKRCVCCGASHTECEIHHRIPWNAPAKGRTDLGDLVLLCGPCHRRLHANNHTLYRHPTTRHWKQRPATPDETPPPRPPTQPPPRE